MSQKNLIVLLGYASGIAAEISGCGDAPVILQQSDICAELNESGWQSLHWAGMLFPIEGLPVLATVADLCERLAVCTKKLTEQKQFFTVFGGDHSCAIGTWSGVASALKQQGPLGLLWIDAHMDSHTFDTTPSGNIHGMPVAALLGYGAEELTKILEATPKILPEHICLIGIRSFENGEAELLRKLGVRIYFIEEVQKRGLTIVMQEALAIVKKGTAAFGISIDVDSIDPHEAPATGTPEANGLKSTELLNALQLINTDPKYIGAEITEYNPHLDENNITLNLIQRLLIALLPRRNK